MVSQVEQIAIKFIDENETLMNKGAKMLVAELKN